MMEERNPYLGFRRMDELGLLAEVHPLLAMNDEKRDMADRVRARARMVHAHVPARRTRPAHAHGHCALPPRPRPGSESLLARLQFSDKRKRQTMQVRSAIMAARAGMTQWEKKKGPISDLHRMLGRAPLETLLYLLAQENNPEQHEKLTRYIYMGRQMKPDINGDDLKRNGHPARTHDRPYSERRARRQTRRRIHAPRRPARPRRRLAVQYVAEEAAAAKAEEK